MLSHRAFRPRRRFYAAYALDAVVWLRTWLDRVSANMARVGGWLFLCVAFYISFDVIARKTLGLTTQAADELSSYVLAIASSWGCGYALAQNGHIRVDIAWRLFSVRVQAILNVLSLALLNLFLALLVWRAWAMVYVAFNLGSEASTPLSTPLVYPQGLWAFGLTWFGFVAALRMLEASLCLITAGMERTARQFGPTSLEQELDRERSAGTPVNLNV